MQEDYKNILLPTAQKHLDFLDRALKNKLVAKIGWLAKHPEISGQQSLKGLPPELKGLCKYRVGDYRIIYRVDYKEKVLKIGSKTSLTGILRRLVKGIKHRRILNKL